MIHLLSVYFAVALSFMSAQAPQPSGTPSCTATCALNDDAGTLLGAGPYYYSISGGVLFCSYPSYPDEDPNDWYCTYDSTTGSLINDRDNGWCPLALVSCSNARRFKGKDNYTAMLRKRDASMKP
ncbi:hypothetical protein B0H12DRAFT_1069685 [Mycena haematopus]|nr:hypothetical protein B0H12DRAFT_1069685 [Mycena haematopus]